MIISNLSFSPDQINVTYYSAHLREEIIIIIVIRRTGELGAWRVTNAVRLASTPVRGFLELCVSRPPPVDLNSV